MVCISYRFADKRTSHCVSEVMIFYRYGNDISNDIVKRFRSLRSHTSRTSAMH